MKHKKVQLAHIYRGAAFLGYGIAVDGALLSQQLSTKIDTDAASIPAITAVFNLDAEMNENPVKIDLNDNDYRLNE
ncbi:hypothetical protein SMD51_002261 [Cronobacter sakazakii]|uniref:hypothetical protein n=1 Tax=Cronobacter sakazakii TaxID=28141 RepID=UPI000A111DE4|nr:hypothetical protein [Cronobacter sakazakii]EGT5708796.1 hypothetical protein [Cronobacter sakazakii]EIZ2463228.1 hypothetical protein [Cronobacter sakazakii]EJG0809497.1 hypothetical protein [Cronobacter sakazakii]ELY2955847.1 hypothetical protein [Cronobacter sakazakii]ELZ3146607.1 hypothetical protein [Cronobacter sakazakii]